MPADRPAHRSHRRSSPLPPLILAALSALALPPAPAVAAAPAALAAGPATPTQVSAAQVSAAQISPAQVSSPPARSAAAPAPAPTGSAPPRAAPPAAGAAAAGTGAVAGAVDSARAVLDAQLARGETLYVLACAMCHGDRLEGVSAPALSGDDFRAAYVSLPPRALHDLIRDTMPENQRGTLSAQEVLDVTAYLLRQNDLSLGGHELAAAEVADTPPSRP